ncbi:hypothetical protein ACLB2K_042426 [Fragaria x ananassa]
MSYSIRKPPARGRWTEGSTQIVTDFGWLWPVKISSGQNVMGVPYPDPSHCTEIHLGMVFGVAMCTSCFEKTRLSGAHECKFKLILLDL